MLSLYDQKPFRCPVIACRRQAPSGGPALQLQSTRASSAGDSAWSSFGPSLVLFSLSVWPPVARRCVHWHCELASGRTLADTGGRCCGDTTRSRSSRSTAASSSPRGTPHRCRWLQLGRSIPVGMHSSRTSSSSGTVGPISSSQAAITVDSEPRDQPVQQSTLVRAKRRRGAELSSDVAVSNRSRHVD
jgi:hypothetical protein